MFDPWTRLLFESAQLAVEAQRVVALRMVRIMTPGATGGQEIRRMVSEKASALAETATAAARMSMTGASAPAIARDTVRRYRRKVRGNMRRLAS